MPFDALMSNEEKDKIAIAATIHDAREAARIPVSRDSQWTTEILSGVSGILSGLSQVTNSEMLAKLAVAVQIVEAKESRVPQNCPHVQPEAFRPAILHLCTECLQKWYDTMTLPIP